MAKIISLVNQKGGVGKTTTAVNIAAYFVRAGKKVLLVDLDPQGNATSAVGLKSDQQDKGTYHALLDSSEARGAIQATPHDVFCLPATIDLAGANIELVDMPNREFRLSQAVETVRPDYDFIIIDCPPSLGLLSINGLVAADELLIPVQAEYLALEGLSHLLQTINLVQNNLKNSLGILGAVITMYDSRNRLSSAVLQELQQYFPNKVFQTVIPRNVKLAEAPSYGQPISHYDPSSRGGEAYENLARELLAVYNQ
ncbi:MAG: ParA family protein [bacterium]